MLTVDDTNLTFEFSDATKGSTGLYSWGLSGLDWSSTITVTVRLSRPTTPDDFPADTTTTGQVDVGGSVTGNLDDENDLDGFRVDLEAGGIYSFDLEGAATGRGTLSDPHLSLYSDSFNVSHFIGEDDDGGEGVNSRLTYTATASGTYHLEVTEQVGATGTYTLSVRDLTPPPSGFVEGATDLPADTNTTGVVEVDGFGARGGIHEPMGTDTDIGTLNDPEISTTYEFDTDWFAVDLEAGGTYRIEMKGRIIRSPALDMPGEPVDPELTLSLPQINAIYDADGDYLLNTWGADESSAHFLFRVTFHARAGGVYYIAASGESFAWGGYELTVIDITGDAERKTTHTQTDRANGVKDSFWVKAQDDNGHGPPSEEVSVTPTSGSAVDLGTPVLSKPETRHHGMVKLDWGDIEGAGWYVVQYYHNDGDLAEWLDLPAVGVDVAFHGSSAVVSNLDGRLTWFRVGAASCAGASEWSQVEEWIGTKASDWEDVPVPVVEAGDEIEPCPADLDTPDNSPATGAPTITGTAQVGETLTANTTGIADSDGPADVSYTYQWRADATDIAGATGSTYTLSAADEGKTVKVRVTFTDDAGNEETLSSAATAAVAAAPQPNNPATGAPAITGTAQVGETLTADTAGIADADGLSNVSYSYQWLADAAAIAAATANTYTLADSDAGKTVTVQVSFTDDAGNDEAVTSGATDTVASKPNSPASGAPAISGTAQVGETLTADTAGIADADGLSNVSYGYQWLAGAAAIAAATANTYTLADSDAGKTVQVRVSFTDSAGNEETLTSEATAAVAAAPTPLTAWFKDERETHSGSTDAFSEAIALSYQTLRDHSLEVTGGSVTQAKRVDGQSDLWEVTIEPDSNTEVGIVLAADRACDVAGAVCTKEGKRLSNRLELTVAFVTAPATAPPPAPPNLKATANRGGSITLTWDAPDDDSITGYQILRRRPSEGENALLVYVEDTGSTATSYTDTDVMVGIRHIYRVKAINSAGVGQRSKGVRVTP